MNVLVVNAGSSSLKYQLLTVETREILAQGACERIGEGDSTFTFKTKEGSQRLTLAILNHRTAISLVLGTLLSKQDETPIDAIGHRIVHGGAYFKDSCIVDDTVIRKIEEIAPLAPLHNYAAASVIEACREVLPQVPSVVCFDTSFHSTIPEVAYKYALPDDLCESLKLRKYGFHGISHRYIAMTCNELTEGRCHRLISCHLGNGSSISAIVDGVCMDTTMGFTPLDGLMMGTRCGSIDPAAVTYIIENTDYNAHDVDMIMNKKSGLLAVSGLTNDIRDLIDAAKHSDKRARLALDMFCYDTRKYIGMMLAVMGGVDTLAFTAGAGQNSPEIRKLSLSGMENLGFKIDDELNEQHHDDPWRISADDSPVSIFVVPAGEEYMIALDTKRLIEGSSQQEG
jgi:acetate kinase